MNKKHTALLAGIFLAAPVLALTLHCNCRPLAPDPFDELVGRGRAIGLTPVPSRDPGSDAVFLVRNPATFVEPPILNLPGQAAGWVRVRRVTPGTHVADIPGQWVRGDCELIDDEALIRPLASSWRRRGKAGSYAPPSSALRAMKSNVIRCK